MHTSLSARNRIILFVSMLAGIILILSSLGMSSPIAYAQEQGTPSPRMLEVATVMPDTPPSSRYYSVSTQLLSNGELVDKHNINGPSVPPPGFELERQPVGLPQSGDTAESDIGVADAPAYVYGCSPTGAATIMIYQENEIDPYPTLVSSFGDGGLYSSFQDLGPVAHYPNLYTGPANGGVLPWNNNAWPTWTDACGDTYSNNPLIASKQGLEGRTPLGTIDNYWVCYESLANDPYITAGRSPHPPETLADYMLTGQSARGNKDGSTTFITYANSARPLTCDVAAIENLADGTLGRKLFYESRGYAVAECYNQPTDNVAAGGFSLAQFRAEIDAGRPVMIGLQGHNVVGIGYNPSSTQIFIRDGWDFNVHTMNWGGSYTGLPMLMVSMVNPVPVAAGKVTISGYVGVPNATITYPGGSTKASITGYYSITVSPGWSGRVTPSKPGYTFSPPFEDYNNVPGYKMKQNYTAAPVPNSNLVRDPSFELGISNPHWTGTSTNFGTPLCDASCGDGARTGSVWGWFGGTTSNETATLSQTITIPSSSSASLDFYLWMDPPDAGSNASDVFTVKVDGTTLFSANATQFNSYSAYIPVSVNVSAYANGAPHTITFGAVTTGQIVSFHLDDVSLAVGSSSNVTISGNTGVSGVTLGYVDGTFKTVVSNSSGNYSITVPRGWSGTVTPSKAGYVFTPPNRTYNNVQSPQTGQNYTAVANYSISGNAGAAGVTLSYTYGTPRTIIAQANGNYSLSVAGGWTGTVTPLHACFTFSPGNRSYSNLAGNLTSQNYTATFKTGSGCASINARVGGANQGWFGLPAGASARASFAGINNGPVEIVSNNDVPLIGAERVIYNVNGVDTSFTELMALPDSQLDTTYWLPWYNNTDLNTQLRFANVSASQATVTVTIGGVPQPSFNLAAGASTRVSYPVNNGPVKIVSTQNIVAAERVIYKVNNVNTSFTEMMALPQKQLDKVYYLPWYNNVDLATQLRIANVSGSPATVTVTIGGAAQPAFDLPAGASTRVSYPVNNGPVKIQGTQNIVAAERVIYKVNGKNTSFSEMMALPAGQLNNTYWLPWYNNVDLDTQLRIANISASNATVHIYIGGQEMLGSPFTLAPGASTRKSFAGINSGPVQTVSNQHLVAAERVIYKVNGVNTSFSEMMGLPDSLLDITYWLPWYNNVDLDTQLRFGVP